MKKSIFVELENKHKRQNACPKEASGSSRKHPGIYMLRQIEYDIERLKYEQMGNDISLILLGGARDELKNILRGIQPKDRTLDDEVKLRLDILEEGIKKVIAKMDNVPMFNRFICLNNLQNGLIVLSNGREPGQTDIQRVARLEMGIGEALNFLQTSKLAKRFNLLKEIKKDLEEVIDRSSQV